MFQIVSFQDHQSRILGQGGRYDQLLGLYHPQKKTSPGVGFSLNIEELHACLQADLGYLEQTLISDYLIVPKTDSAKSQAFIYAQKLRKKADKKRVEIDLGGRNIEEIKEYARSRSIPQIIWVMADGNTEIETLE